MQRNKKLERVANKIIKLERKISLGKNVQETEFEIQKIMDSLTIEDMMFIDDYIMKKQKQKN